MKMNPAAIGLAMLKALIVWILIYASVVFYQAFEKYDDVHHIVVKQVNVTKEIILDPEIQIVEKIVEIEEPPRTISPQEQAIFDRVPTILENMEQAKQKQDKLTTEIQIKLEELVDMRAKYDEDLPQPPAKETISVELTYLPALLRLPSLSHTDDDAFTEVFQGAWKEVQHFLQSKDTVEWGALNQFFHPQYERKIDQPEAANCPDQPEYIPDPTVVRESHLTQNIQRIEAIIKERTESEALHRLLASKSTKQKMEMVIAEHKPKPSQQPMQQKAPDRVCILEDEFSEMLDDGLQALKTNAPLDRVLVGWVSQLDPNEKNLILDPVLPKSTPPDTEPPSQINLRQVVDSELLQQSSKIVDALVDLTSGYNDFVDQQVDKLLASNPESTSVGRIAVSKLLQLLGQAEVPNFIAQIPSKKGILG